MPAAWPPSGSPGAPAARSQPAVPAAPAARPAPPVLPVLQPVSSARLPVPPGAPSAHAASLAFIADPARPDGPDGGRLLAVWWAGSRESGPDVRVYLSVLGPEGWQAPRAVADRESLGRALGFSVRRIGNAVLHPAGGGRLHLFVVATGLGGWAAARVVHLVAPTPDAPFALQRVLPLTPLANTSMLVRAQTVPLADGGWWLPAYFEIGLKYPVLLRFDAHGELRSMVRIGRSMTSLQPTIVALPEGSWRALMRDHGPQRRIQVADSVDGGLHWVDGPALTLSSHDTAPAAATLRASDGTPAGHVLAYNDTAEAGSTPRSVLRLALSADGRSWQPGPDVQRAEAGAEFSYPNLLQVGQRLHVVYTHRRDGIAHQVFAMAEVSGTQAAGVVVPAPAPAPQAPAAAPAGAWPALAWQVAYADLAWALVLAAALCALLDGVLPDRASRSAARRRVRDGLVLAAALALSVLPGGARAAFDALGLALQQPSGLLTALAVLMLARRLARPDRRAPALPTVWATLLVGVGALLYVDALGWTPWQLYRLGMPGTGAASLAVTVLAVGAALHVALDGGRSGAASTAAGPALALLVALVLHVTLQLPTGNLWDALLDPMLWSWALVVVLARGVGVAMRTVRPRPRELGLS